MMAKMMYSPYATSLLRIYCGQSSFGGTLPCLILIFLLRQKGCLPKVLEGLRRECRTWRGRPLRLVVWARGSCQGDVGEGVGFPHYTFGVGWCLRKLGMNFVASGSGQFQLLFTTVVGSSVEIFVCGVEKKKLCVQRARGGGGVEVSSHADQASGMRMHPLRLHSIDGCLGYNAKISTIRSLMLFEVVSFAVFLTSSLVAHDLKIMIKLVNGAESNEEFI
ncbi:hypothetical protein CK203_052682 [Vitis vinifera]|uniref:Uncharacterized protein n=1 Tax=Vitis vinifera TaxID=29760 RepID=A0A438GH98_VITVI|nr:hypothetical protein CK203_052682 [Vitis vinifera]